MKILVTGHKGFIGKKIFDKLTKTGYIVKGIDLKLGDDILHCLPNEKFDYVFHLAALPSVEYSVINPSYTMKQNVLTTSVLLEWSKNHFVKRFILSSSAAVMGNGDGFPKSPYGLHKLFNEMECRLYSELYGLDTVCLRYYNVYSEDQKYGGTYSSIISAWMEMIKKGNPLRIDGDGEQTRDFIHVDDIVSANLFCMQHTEEFNGQCFSVSSGKSVTINYIKEFINNLHSVKWARVPQRDGDIKHSTAVGNCLQNVGWIPKVSIDDGLRRCFEFK